VLRPPRKRERRRVGRVGRRRRRQEEVYVKQKVKQSRFRPL
jgi:hypothetical protein